MTSVFFGLASPLCIHHRGATEHVPTGVHRDHSTARPCRLVTGSTDGIGAAVARALATEGAHVIISGRNTDRADQVVRSITKSGRRADFIAADLSSGSGIASLAEAATRVAGGRLDILINNAAMLITPAPTGDVTERLIDQAFAVNVRAPFLLTGLLAPAMAARGQGAIVNGAP